MWCMQKRSKDLGKRQMSSCRVRDIPQKVGFNHALEMDEFSSHDGVLPGTLHAGDEDLEGSEWSTEWGKADTISGTMTDCGRGVVGRPESWPFVYG